MSKAFALPYLREYLCITSTSLSAKFMVCCLSLGAGLAIMGDLTYRHVFGGNDTTGEVTNRQLPTADATDDSLFGQLQSCAVQETENNPETRSLEEAPEARCTIALNSFHNCFIHYCSQYVV